MFTFPNPLLKPAPVTDLLGFSGIRSFHDAVNWVWKLPYGRTSDRSNYLLVPVERRGACSGKHAFLSAIADEQNVPLRLSIGIFLMNRKNTPKIAAALKDAPVKVVPEAHCYLRFQDRRYDFTSYESGGAPNLDLEFLHEEFIQPDQIRNYKTELHMKWMQRWLQETEQVLSVEELWAVRENCISALEL